MWRSVRGLDGSLAFHPVAAEKRPLAVIGVRACDLAALALQDAHFLAQSADPWYAARRAGLFLVAVHCTHPAETCFCASTGDGPTCGGGFDLALHELNEGFIVEVGSDAGQAVFQALDTLSVIATRRCRPSIAPSRPMHGCGIPASVPGAACCMAIRSVGQRLLEAGPSDPEAQVDIAFVEGSICTPEELERIGRVRANSAYPVTLGACATSGGLQALRNLDRSELAWRAAIYALPEALLDWVATLPLPHQEQEFVCVALRHEQEYPMYSGRIVASEGLNITASEYEAHFEEYQCPHSTALFSRLQGRDYLVGPLARLNLNRDRLPPAGAEALRLGECLGLLPLRLILIGLGEEWPETLPELFVQVLLRIGKTAPTSERL